MAKVGIYFISALSGLIGLMATFWVLNSNFIQSPYNGPNKISVEIENHRYNVEVLSTPVLKLDITDTPSRSLAQTGILFHWNPIFMVWTMLMLGLMMICSVIFPSYLMVVKTITREFDVSGKSLLIAIAATLLFIAIMSMIFFQLEGYYRPSHIIRDFHILLRNYTLIPTFATIPIILVGPVMVTFFLIPFIADQLKLSNSSEKQVRKFIMRHKRLDTILQNSLYVLATMVVLSILCSSALRESIKATITFREIDIFPKDVSYVYGLFYTLFLAILYLPSQFVLHMQYSEVKENLMSEPNRRASEDTDWVNKIFEGDEKKTSVWDKVKLAATLFSPLISAFIPESFFS